MHRVYLVVNPVCAQNKLANDRDSECIADMTLYVSNGVKENALFDIRWNYTILKKWLLKNKEQILNEELPEFFSSGESIAQGIFAFYENVNPDDDSLIDQAQAYREKHGFRFALRGANIPDIYIGRKGSIFEISVKKDSGFLAFDIDIDDFFTKLDG